MPARLKEFWAQVFRPGCVGGAADLASGRQGKLQGKIARIVVTMGMPVRLYRWYSGAHSLKCLDRNRLGFRGIGSIKENLIGLVETEADRRREKWLERMRGFERAGARMGACAKNGHRTATGAQRGAVRMAMVNGHPPVLGPPAS